MVVVRIFGSSEQLFAQFAVIQTIEIVVRNKIIVRNR